MSFNARILVVLFVIVVSDSLASTAEEPVLLKPTSVNLLLKPLRNEWREWVGVCHHRWQRITALSVGQTGEVWVGTSDGRLLSMADDKWVVQAELHGTQIRSIATVVPETVWLSTNEGLRRLDWDKGSWKLTSFRSYYQGHPAFVSGGYLPGEDAVRWWGHVDRVYIPPRENTYAPFAISNEHGLFSFGGYGTVWHHYLPHYWGANSEWMDLRKLIPHRRPTSMVEDADSHLWIGTQWEGIVRLNGHARVYHERSPKQNDKDGTEFTFIDSKEVGVEFDEVVSLARGVDRGIWAVLALKDQREILARFDGQAWSTMRLHGKGDRANCIAEVEPGTILVGLQENQRRSIVSIDWESQKIEPVKGPQYDVFEIVSLPDGRVFAASPYGLFEKNTADQN